MVLMKGNQLKEKSRLIILNYLLFHVVDKYFFNEHGDFKIPIFSHGQKERIFNPEDNDFLKKK